MSSPDNKGQDEPTAIHDSAPPASGEKVSTLHQEEEDLKNNLVTSKKNVQNVALAEAMALQKPSLLTINMFRVSSSCPNNVSELNLYSYISVFLLQLSTHVSMVTMGL